MSSVFSVCMEWPWELCPWTGLYELYEDDGILLGQGHLFGTYWPKIIERGKVTILGQSGVFFPTEVFGIG